MKRIIQYSGIHVVLLLYCFAIFSFNTNQVVQIEEFATNDTVDDCRSSQSTTLQVYSEHLELQLKLSSEKREGFLSKKNLEKSHYTCASIVEVDEHKTKLKIPTDILASCFSETDVIYPFHSFW